MFIINTYTKTRTNVYSLNYHLVWTTKYRKPIFDSNDKKQKLKDIILNEANNNSIIIKEMEVAEDYVHLLISIPPKLSISSVVKILKGRSGFLYLKAYSDTKKDLYKGHLWSGSYFVSSTGGVTSDIIKKYIENQNK